MNTKIGGASGVSARGHVLAGVNYEVYGTGRPIFFVHGWRLDLTTEVGDFEDGVPALRDWGRIYVDLPGMGLSAVRPELQTLGDYANWVRAAIDALIPAGEPVALAGTSAGAALLLHAALSGGCNVKGLLMRMPLMAADRRSRAISDVDLRPHEQREREDKIRTLWAPAEERVTSHVEGLRADPERYSLPIELRELSVPCLVITGRQDSRVGFSQAFDLTSFMPHGTFVTIDGAEHDYPYRDDGLFVALVEDWLRRVDRVWD